MYIITFAGQMIKPKTEKKGSNFENKKKRSQKSVGTPVFLKLVSNRPINEHFPNGKYGRDYWDVEPIV